MTEQEEPLTSEKLFDPIRDTSSSTLGVEAVGSEIALGESTPFSPLPHPTPSFFQIAIAAIRGRLAQWRSQTKTTIAIDIQPGMVHLVKASTGKQGHEIQAIQSFPYPCDSHLRPDSLFENPAFTEPLLRALSTFIPRHGHHEIWCSYAFCNPVALHNVGIPKVADKDIPNAVFWSAKREVDFDENSSLFDYSVLQEVRDGNQQQTKIQTLISLVPRREVEGVSTMFKNAGFPLTGLTFPAGAIQNFLNHDPSVPHDSPVVFFTIRKHCSHIDLFCLGKMFFSREIKTGADSFVESLMDHAQSRDIVIDEERAKRYIFRSQSQSGAAQEDIDELLSQLDFDAMSVIDRLVRQLMRTFEYCGSNFKVPPVSKIFTTGEFTVNAAILQAIEDRVGIKCEVITPLSSPIFARIPALSATNPNSLLVAAGLSLSRKESTVNFLYTHADRFAEAATRKINAIIATLTIVLTLGCGAFFAWQHRLADQKQSAITALRSELDRKYREEPRSRSTDYATQTMSKISQFHRDNQKSAARFKAVGMIGEVVKAVGQEITLTGLTLDLEPKGHESQDNKDEAGYGLMHVSGAIKASPDEQEFVLMNFLKKLSQLTLLGSPNLTSKTNAIQQGKDILQFEIDLKVTLTLLKPAKP